MDRRSAAQRTAIRRAGPWIGGALAAILAGCAPIEPGLSDATPDGIDAITDAISDRADRGLDDAGADGAAARLDAASDRGLDAAPDAMADAIPDAASDASADAIPDVISDVIADGSDPDAIAAADGEPPAPPDAAPVEREIVCDDGLDDDGDGAVDCHDGDCLDDAPCLLVPETPVQRIQELFNQRCGCHTGLVALGGLSLQAPFTDTTVGVPATLDPDWQRIAPGDPGASLLYVKLTAEVPPGLGDRMPPEMPFLGPDQIGLVEGWIEGIGRPRAPSAGENGPRGSP